MNDGLPAPIEAAVDEWLDRNAPISRAEFDRRNSAFIRRVGDAATHPDLGRNKHLRKTSAADAGAFAADADVALAELDETVTYADLHGVAHDGGYVPILICLGGDIDSVSGRMHRLYHAVDDVSACQRCAVTDGGADSLTESDEGRIRQFLEDRGSIDDVDVDDIVDAVPGLPDDDLVRAEVLAILDVAQERRDGGLDTYDYDTITTQPGQVHAIHECEPPAMDAEPFDRRGQWDRLQGPQYDAVVGADTPAIWQHQAGAGKTTNAALAALERDRSVTMLFDKHEKAREVVTDDALADADLDATLGADWDPYHLKGGEQKRHPHCMDADHADEACPEHGHSSNCPSMCPIYDLEADSDLRQRYDAVARELGDIRAHVLLADELPEHDEDGRCPWSEQFGALENEDQVVGVHEYQTLKTVTGGRDVIVDEAPSSLRTERHLTVDGCVRLANALEDFADVAPRDDPVGQFQSRSGFSPCLDRALNGPKEPQNPRFQSRSGFSPCLDERCNVCGGGESDVSIPVWVFSLPRPAKCGGQIVRADAVSIPVWVFSLPRHTIQFEDIWELLDETPSVPIAVDAVGEGSGKADDTAARYAAVERFKSGETAVQEGEYKDRWTEGLCEFGEWLQDGGIVADAALRSAGIARWAARLASRTSAPCLRISPRLPTFSACWFVIGYPLRAASCIPRSGALTAPAGRASRLRSNSALIWSAIPSCEEPLS